MGSVRVTWQSRCPEMDTLPTSKFVQVPPMAKSRVMVRRSWGHCSKKGDYSGVGQGGHAVGNQTKRLT